MTEKVAKMREMAELEKRYAVGYDDNVDGLGNVAVAELMMSVALDSRKHAGLYRVIAAILEGSLGITDVEYDKLEVALKGHVEVEVGMLSEARWLLKGVEDDRARRLLEKIVVDEVRHHAFLSVLLEAMLARDMIWRDVPTQGTPRDPYAPGR